jgi:putative oxidoreductase
MANVTALLRTDRAVGPALLRAVLATVIFPHGAQHLLGWFGGSGFAGTHGWMTGLGFPSGLASVAIAMEFVAPIALAIGFASRAAALGIIGIMVVR